MEDNPLDMGVIKIEDNSDDEVERAPMSGICPSDGNFYIKAKRRRSSEGIDSAPGIKRRPHSRIDYNSNLECKNEALGRVNTTTSHDEVSDFVRDHLKEGKIPLAVDSQKLLEVVRMLYDSFTEHSKNYAMDRGRKRLEFNKMVFKYLKNKFNWNTSSILTAVGPWRQFLKKHEMLVSMFIVMLFSLSCFYGVLKL